MTESYAYLPGTNVISSVTAMVGGPMVKTYHHDADGNILTEEIEQSNAPAKTPADFLYTSDGLRVKKTTASGTVVYHYDLSGNLIGESDVTGNAFTAYIYMDGLRIATVAPSGNICYYHTNHLETPEKMTNESGTVVWKADYKPFGEAVVDPSSTVVNSFRFPGQYYDSETGLHYNWNRYFDPNLGRYLTADPIGLQGGTNLYTYAINDPINYSDINGLISNKTKCSLACNLSIGDRKSVV
jgi:RHS repeat-associated protein